MSLPWGRNPHWLAATALFACSSYSWAAGLGSIDIQSSLGQPLRASVPVNGFSPDNGSNCVKAVLRTLDGQAVTPRVGMVQNGQSVSLQLTTRQAINDPAALLSISLGCESPIQREYQILLDPVLTLPAVPRAAAVPAPVTETRSKPLPPPRVIGKTLIEPSADVAPRKSRKTRTATVSNAVENDLGTAAPKAVKRQTKKEKRAERSVLRLSGATRQNTPDPLLAPPPDEPISPTMQLRRSDTLTLSVTPTEPGRMSELRAEQERFSALMRDEDPNLAAQQTMQKLQAELDAAKVEGNKLKEQSQADRNALAVQRTESLNWIGALAWLLLVALVGVAWLIWRLAAAKNNAARAEWAALIAARNTTINFSPSEIQYDEYDTEEFPEPIDPGVASPNSVAVSHEEQEQEVDDEVIDPSAPAPATVPATVPAMSAPAAKPVAAPPQPAKVVSHDRTIMPNDRTVQTTVRPARQNDETVPPYVVSPQAAAARKEDHTMKAEEISDVVELAEAWMALNDPHKVLELLDPFSAVEHPESPLPWLCLLEVYRTLGQQDKYEAILERITSRFNVRLAPWDKEADSEPPKSLADYPHISETILSLWENTGEAVAYMKQLQRDNRHGTRAGFDLPVYRDILKLISLAEHGEVSNGKAVMSEKAYAILFPDPEQIAAAHEARQRAAAPNIAVPVAGSPEALAAAKALLPVRPKYITTAYKRPVLTDGVVQNKPGSAPQPPAAPAPVARPTVAATAQAAPPVAKTFAPATPRFPAVDVPAPAAAQPVLARALLDHHDDDSSPIGIKLHLAVAYYDIGDKEGAYVLLDEVVKEGTAAEADQAKKLLAKLRL
jgi:pilus assembly protein FimV